MEVLPLLGDFLSRIFLLYTSLSIMLFGTFVLSLIFGWVFGRHSLYSPQWGPPHLCPDFMDPPAQRYPGKPKVVLLSMGHYSPPHRGHIGMFSVAKSSIEATLPVEVIGAIMCPYHDVRHAWTTRVREFVWSKHRLEMCRLCVQSLETDLESPMSSCPVCVCAWDTSPPNGLRKLHDIMFNPPHAYIDDMCRYACEFLHEAVPGNSVYYGVQVYYTCSPKHALRNKVWKCNAKVVVVGDDDASLSQLSRVLRDLDENDVQNIMIVRPSPANGFEEEVEDEDDAVCGIDQQFTSCGLRDALRCGDASKVAMLAPDQVHRYIVQHELYHIANCMKSKPD